MFGLTNKQEKNNVPEDKNNILDVKVKSYADCGYCKDTDNEEGLTVPWEIYSRWLYLCNQFQDKEWGGIFTVLDSVASDFLIPKQEVGTASVEFSEELGGNGIVHSHHNMGAFHSTQDDNHCRNLYDYSVVLTNGKGYVATRRRELPCGAFGYVDVKLLVSGIPENLDIDKITESVGAGWIENKNGTWSPEKDKDDSPTEGFDRRDRRDLFDRYNELRQTELHEDVPLDDGLGYQDEQDTMADICANCAGSKDKCETCADYQEYLEQNPDFTAGMET